MANLQYNCDKCKFTTTDRLAAVQHAQRCPGKIVEVKIKARTPKTSTR